MSDDTGVSQRVGHDPLLGRTAVLIGSWLHGQFSIFFKVILKYMYLLVKTSGFYFAGLTFHFNLPPAYTAPSDCPAADYLFICTLI